MNPITPDIAYTILAAIGLLFISAFFSGSETALTATSRARMHSRDQNGEKRARTVIRLTDDPERLIGGILLGNNLVNILATSLMATAFLAWFDEGGQYIATIVMTALVVIFAEVMPKTVAISKPDKFAMIVAPVLRWVVLVLAPIIRLVQLIVRGTLKLLFNMDISQSDAVLSVNDELRGAIDLHHKEERLDKESRDLIRGALELDVIKIEDVMVHRKSIEMIDLGNPVEENIRQALNSRHTRLPVFDGDSDNIVGVVHAKDLSRALWSVEGRKSDIDLSAIARDPYFVPETTTLSEQLDMFRLKQEHFALVIDEYGAIMGLVTMEDILEEIVGEIEDEYDSPVQGIRPQADGSIHVDGDVTIRDLNRAMDWNLPDEEAVTIAGLVIHDAQTIPEIGQTFSYHGFKFSILRRRRNQITAIKITEQKQAVA